MSETIIMTHNDSIWVNALEAHKDSLQCNIDLLQTKLDALETKTDLLHNIIEPANSSISNQLTAVTVLLAILGLIIAIVGFWLGAYINNKKKQIDEIAEKVEHEKASVDEIAKKTQELDLHVRKNLSDLYKDLRKEETNALLDRLILEPNDISNLGDLLLSRAIDTDLYPKLKEAYLKLLKENAENPETEDKDYKFNYLILFFQHFFYLTIKDDEIAPCLIENFKIEIATAFKRDIQNSTIQLCRALSDSDSTFNKEDVLVDYLKALNESSFKAYKDLKNILEQSITPSTLLQNAIDRCKADKVYLVLFGINPPEGNEAKPQ